MTTRKAQDEPLPVDALEASDDIVLDFSVIEDAEVLPEGPYLCMIEDFKPGLSRNEKKKIEVTYLISEPSEYEGRKVKDHPSLEPNALFNIHNILRALGEDNETLKSGKFQVKPSDYLGRSIVVTISHRMFNDRTTYDVSRVQHADKWAEMVSF